MYDQLQKSMYYTTICIILFSSLSCSPKIKLDHLSNKTKTPAGYSKLIRCIGNFQINIFDEDTKNNIQNFCKKISTNIKNLKNDLMIASADTLDRYINTPEESHRNQIMKNHFLSIENKFRSIIQSHSHLIINEDSKNLLTENLILHSLTDYKNDLVKSLNQKQKLNQNLLQPTNAFKKLIIESSHTIHSITHPQVYTPITTHLTEKEITKTINENLTSKYDRKSLGFLDDQTLTQPTEPPYSFLSEESEFLDQLKSLYQQLREANPYHEQGILARQCGLKQTENMDQLLSEKKFEEFHILYHETKWILPIVKGQLPTEGEGRVTYETCTGKNLFTGLPISKDQIKNETDIGISL